MSAEKIDIGNLKGFFHTKTVVKNIQHYNYFNPDPQLNALFENVRITRPIIERIYNEYGKTAYLTVRKNPYQLIDDIYGVGFIIADGIAKNCGIRGDDERRVRAATMYILNFGITTMGHTCYGFNDLIPEIGQLLEDQYSPIIKVVEKMLREESLTEINGLIYSPELYKIEKYVGEKLLRLLNFDVTGIDYENINTSDLKSDQIYAIEKLAQSNVFILTGAPGTGKTFLIKFILSLFNNQKIKSAAPTGKAAKRIMEQSGHEASTIHRLLEPMFNPTTGRFQFTRNEICPIDADIIILDEVSMVDVKLFEKLLRAINPGTRLIMIGDTYQLPPVGAGYVLRDMIRSDVIPYAELTIIKRQNPGLIIGNCHAIKNGNEKLKFQDENSNSDCWFLHSNKIEDIKIMILHQLMSFPKHDRLRDIQVITPLREKTELGCKFLNEYLQDKLNSNPAINISKQNKIYQFRVGDKVIQTKNDYEKNVLNGDIGYIEEIDTSKRMLTVEFETPKRSVRLSMYNNKLQLAYAITCHKYQGSENKVIIIPIHKCFGSLIMQRNWLYTAISRASELCILIGDKSEIPKIIGRNFQIKRFTNLQGFLKKNQGENK